MIERLRAAAGSRPATAAAVIALAFPALGLLARLFVHAPVTVRGQLPRETAAAAALLLVVWLLGWGRRTGLTAALRRPMNLLGLATLVLAYSGLGAFEVRQRGLHDAAAAVLLALLIGLAEETLVRGIVLGGLAARGPLLAGLVSAVYFGLLHLSNLLIRFEPVILAQAGAALLIGLLLGAVRLRVESLWPLVATHALVDLPALLSGTLVPASPSSPWLALVPLVGLTPWAALGLGMLLWDEAHRP